MTCSLPRLYLSSIAKARLRHGLSSRRVEALGCFYPIEIAQVKCLLDHTKEEALDQILIPGERTLSYVMRPYLVHDHAERNHQDFDNPLIAPASDSRSHSGRVRRQARLGGYLSYYYRDAA
jgi:hypothetical protein